MAKLSQEENSKNRKRLKSLDESSKTKIANEKQLNTIMNELYKTSKTYEHNQEVLKNQNNLENRKIKEPIFSRFTKAVHKTIILCLKCILYFVIGFILLTIIYTVFFL